MFYATRGVHWCNKKNHDEHRGVNHSQLMLPFKTCIRTCKAREPSGWRDRKFEIARVARAQTGHTSGCTHRQITAWQTLQADPHILEYERLRECHNGAVLRLHPDLPRAHRPLAARLLCLSGRPRAASPCHHRPGRPEAGCRRGPQRTDRPCLRVRVHVWRLNACVSKRHELSVREHERWRGECRRAGAPYSIDLVEPSTCESGSRAGDRACSAPCAEHLRTANRHSK